MHNLSKVLLLLTPVKHVGMNVLCFALRFVLEEAERPEVLEALSREVPWVL